MAVRYQDWLRQAQRDLEHAKKALSDEHYEWACFAAQQSAEKGVKALYLKLNRDAWGHSVAGLLGQLPDPWKATKALIDAGKELDKHYIPPRYPNSYPEGAPFEYYTQSEAERAIAHTGDILSFCKSVLAESGRGQDASEGSGTDPGAGTS